MTTQQPLQRVQEMEARMDALLAAVARQQDIGLDPVLTAHFHTLSQYMRSGDWLADYDRHSRGEFPKELKCGVLAQDTLYDLLLTLSKHHSLREKTDPAAE